MNVSTPAAGVLFVLVILAGAAFYVRRMLSERRRTRSLRALIEHADQLEHDLKECRQRLGRAHAVMSLVPGQPAAGEDKARLAIDSGLRALLEHRLWIRDHVADASQRELDAAVEALREVRTRLQPQLRALDQAQHDLDEAVRERIERDARS